MGEENKEEEKKEEEKKEEGSTEAEKKKEVDEKKAEEPQEIVLKVYMHCEACARKIVKTLKGFEGVEEVVTDYKCDKVIVKGKTADPIKVCERVQKKSGRKVELISPLPKPPEEEKKEESPPEKKDEPPPVVTVTLKVYMHCEACAQVLQKRIRKIEGVESVATDVSNDQVMVKGVVDPEKLVENVYKRTRKQASIVKDEEKKEEEKKEEEKKEEEDKGEKKEEKESKGEEDNKADVKKFEYYGPKYHMEYYYPYPPDQIFSDENPNACSVM
ncbi:heavy metal-associated isoprenylated plant protein 7-like [Macadamia integrifolia]|uniref:heavy metal-associated isoprenylated plant protein 7-like n=1 Tax=Macadamia integrifolia TaxID=60698 RepID=UPI001C52C258|nr:heavy metal-associated isoprenylated plant protein 7-like [Macadamia integrifolia]